VWRRTLALLCENRGTSGSLRGGVCGTPPSRLACLSDAWGKCTRRARSIKPR